MLTVTRPDIARAAEDAVINTKDLESRIQGLRNTLANLCVAIGHHEAARLCLTPAAPVAASSSSFGTIPQGFPNPTANPFATGSPYAYTPNPFDPFRQAASAGAFVNPQATQGIVIVGGRPVYANTAGGNTGYPTDDGSGRRWPFPFPDPIGPVIHPAFANQATFANPAFAAAQFANRQMYAGGAFGTGWPTADPFGSIAGNGAFMPVTNPTANPYASAYPQAAFSANPSAFAGSFGMPITTAR